MRTRGLACVVVAIAACGRSVAPDDASLATPAPAAATSELVRVASTERADDGSVDAAAGSVDLEEGPLSGARYAPARAFVRNYCAECHTERGAHVKKKRALPQQRLDTFEQWRSHASVLRGVLDKWHPDGKTMPVHGASAMPRDDERRAMLEWLDRGSPNTVDGR